jgi:hypothetical protein
MMGKRKTRPDGREYVDDRQGEGCQTASDLPKYKWAETDRETKDMEQKRQTTVLLR